MIIRSYLLLAGLAVTARCILVKAQQYTLGKELKRVSQWNSLDFVFSSPVERENALATRRFIPENCVPLDMDVDYNSNLMRSRVFVTVPRFIEGIPATLTTISSHVGAGGPLLEPYPNAAIQSNPEDSRCNGIVSVFRTMIDDCNRLWIADTGKIGDRRICLPKIVAFDLRTDQIIHRYEIPAAQLVCDLSLLVSILVDVRDPPPLGSCSRTMIYVADVTGSGLIVYDMSRGKSWRVTNRLMNPNPDYGTFTIANESFDLMDGMLTMALSPKIPASDFTFNSAYGSSNSFNSALFKDRLLFFHALASISENAVRTSVLHNDTMWEQDVGAMPRAFRVIGRRTTQSAPEAMDSNGNLFFGLLSQTSIACWDATTNYNPHNFRIVSQNLETLQFPSGLKVIRNRKGIEELWVLTCRFQKIMTGSLNFNETNFRIQAIQIPELLDGARTCKGSR
ncbi:major royal jelly protein 1-like isoform X2 [Wyeomyia smithii]|nr:major royal jelly protein 1-like isoform X2 [Wyeomyia smithii]XP_055523491.1 major royal jelly protein 1-like isoform X2 [Wyeomyia smithii]XP_055523492.1 major royal jelly protein 1-like isoform X2 [Wyeomyia smithii]XP_055523493.1 major royal jelly protein 1-like isoform X2 [Wyeomyia smithii]XP_055523494.1 major royal jelly protein 1-like isoform X2 [Wyeomyia smithii]XP_055523495.1 major royal jelly protein 1-like isoform X2 [Wyeomyia smithii]